MANSENIKEMKERKGVRVRFAPSPTGYLHVGGARTALYNWLFAKKNNGVFILRIEDTDRTRYVPDSVEDIKENLRWLGIEWDEGPDVGGDFGPYFQSERIELYERLAHRLLEEGHAYKCFCSPERLKSLREVQRKLKQRSGYDRHCRFLKDEEIKKLEEEGKSYVIRLKVPLGGKTTFNDFLRGDITYDNRELEDIVLLKSDGYPTYHLANVIDDHYMGVSHVMRADEWIPSTPYHVLLYRAFGWDPPVFAHLPVILAPEGKGKLSKRHGATSVREFREKGYLPEALVNFLALLGWSPGEEEILPLHEMVKRFELSKVGKRGAVFDYQKLLWMNGEYIRRKTDEELFNLALPFMKKEGLIKREEDLEKFRRIVPLLRERVKILGEFPKASRYFFEEVEEYDPKGLKKHFKTEGIFEILKELKMRLGSLDEFKVESIEKVIRGLADERGLGAGKIIHPTRLLLTGRTVGPGLFELMEVLGKETCIRRLELGIERVKALLEKTS